MHLREEIDSSRTNGVAFLMIVGRVKALKPGSRDARNQLAGPPVVTTGPRFGFRWSRCCKTPASSIVPLLQTQPSVVFKPTTRPFPQCSDSGLVDSHQGYCCSQRTRQNFPSPTLLLTSAITLFPSSLPSLVGGLLHRYGLPFSCRHHRLSSH